MSVPLRPATRDALDRLEERDLVERARTEPAAFGELYRRHRERIYSFAFVRLRHQEDAEDLTSEVFMRALAAIGRYRCRGVPFQAWLLQIAAYAVVDQLRRRRHRQHEDVDDHRELRAVGSLEDLVADREQVRRILDAAQELPVRQRMVFALRYGHQLKVTDICRQLRRSEGAVRLMLHRARRGVAGRVG